MTARRSASSVFGLGFAFAFALAACGSSSAPGAVSSQPGGPTASPPGGQAASLPAGGLPSMATVGGGSCKVTVSGGLSLSWESKQDKASLLVSYWLSAATRAALGGSGENFLMNCNGTAATISLYSTNGTTAAQFPEAAGRYVINAHGTASIPGTVAAIVAPKGGNLWNITGPGTFNVTVLNASHFAGTFQLKIAELGPDLKLTGTTATVFGTFDLACTTNSCK